MLPKTEKENDLARLSYVRDQVSDTMEDIQRIQKVAAALLQRHFELIPSAQVLSSSLSSSPPQTPSFHRLTTATGTV
jgi:hypothetical protein